MICVNCKEPEQWRKCGRCICNGHPDCDVAQDRANTPADCKGPYSSFKQQTRRAIH